MFGKNREINRDNEKTDEVFFEKIVVVIKIPLPAPVSAH